MDSLITQVLSWPGLAAALLVFGFAPGAVLRVIVRAFGRDDPRRTELLGELRNVPRIERPFWVCEQLELAISEGLVKRLAEAVRHSSAPQFLRALASTMKKRRGVVVLSSIPMLLLTLPMFAAEEWAIDSYVPGGIWKVALEVLVGFAAFAVSYTAGQWAIGSFDNDYRKSVRAKKSFCLLASIFIPLSVLIALAYGPLYWKYSAKRL